MKKFISVVVALMMVFLLSINALAANATWDGSESALWANNDNWSAAYPANSDTATFNAVPVVPGNTTIDLGAGAGVGNIVFDTANCPAYIIGLTGQNLQVSSDW
ncbi:MAG: hypothetical protein JXB40_05995 [Candidatus Omnitrophica bacterium]|nr:hypothetical protein [Candidatus Omnitrophota bacterium]